MVQNMEDTVKRVLKGDIWWHRVTSRKSLSKQSNLTPKWTKRRTDKTKDEWEKGNNKDQNRNKWHKD